MTSFVADDDLDRLEEAEVAEEQHEPVESPEPSNEEPKGEVGTDLAVREAGTALQVEHLTPEALAIIPPETEMRALVQLAVTLSAAELVPRALRDKPNDTLLVLLTARDLGIKLTTALRLCHPIEGAVTVAPKLKLAIIRERKIARVWPDAANSGESATWYAVRADDPETRFASTFDWEDAQRGGMALWACEGPSGHTEECKAQQRKRSKDRNAPCCKDNYFQWPARMLSWRALGYLMDDACGEVGAGLYSPDELGAITDEDGNAILDVTEVGPLDGTAEPRSMAEARRRQERAATDPKMAPATDAERDLLGRMIRALPDEGVTVATQLWTTAVAVKIADLPSGKVKAARALLDSLWKRAEGGEWGAWERPFDPDAEPDPPEGSDAPESPESDPGPDGAAEGAEPQSDAQGPGSEDSGGDAEEPEAGGGDLDTIDAVIDHVAGLPIEEVDRQLAALEEEPVGDGENDHRRALAVRTARDLGLL